MGRVWHWFVAYMVSYAILMLVSYLLWQASGLYSDVSAGATAGASGGGTGGIVPLSLFYGLRVLSDFLVVFAVFAYPAYSVVKAAIVRLSRRNGMRFGAKRQKARSQVL